MAFDSLSEKLQNVFKKLKGKGRLSESDVKEAVKEVKIALLEADVNFKVVKNFVNTIQEKAVGEDVMKSLTPGQMVIKIVNEELTELMGSEKTDINFRTDGNPTHIMMAGLQGSGKTTTAAKLAGKFRDSGRRPLLVACDVYRPAAVEQLIVNGEKLGIPVFSMGTDTDPVEIAKAAVAHASENRNNVIIFDTAGRLHIDEEMMDEIVRIKTEVGVDETVLVVDAMTGQDAVNVAKTFDEKVGIDGVVLTKMDGDTRGGAALSVKAVTGRPILYVGMGEKLSDLEEFYPDRMASRILGMGDVLTLIEKAQEEIDEEEARKMTDKIRKQGFDFNDYLNSMKQLRKLGGITKFMGMLPGVGSKLKGLDLDSEETESTLHRNEAIIFSMTPKERENPDILNPSRKKRIARGAGVDISEVNRLVKQFDQARKTMKQMPGLMKGTKAGKRGLMGKLPF